METRSRANRGGIALHSSKGFTELASRIQSPAAPKIELPPAESRSSQDSQGTDLNSQDYKVNAKPLAEKSPYFGKNAPIQTSSVILFVAGLLLFPALQHFLWQRYWEIESPQLKAANSCAITFLFATNMWMLKILLLRFFDFPSPPDAKCTRYYEILGKKQCA